MPPCSKHVVIDGNNVCKRLYHLRLKHTWHYGGEYSKFRVTAMDFFQTSVHQYYRKPIVVFDGIDSDHDLKKQTKHRRREDGLKAMRDVQADVADKNSVPPLHVKDVFMAVLRELDIEFHVSDSDREADGVIAALANHYKCPVLSSDSDFFIFELEHGFIHFDRFIQGHKCYYHVKDFRDQFNLPKYELCLLIPLIYGNDFVTPSIKIEQYMRCKKVESYEHFLKMIAEYGSCAKYIDSSPRAIPAGCTPKSLNDQLEIVKGLYSILDPAPYLPGGLITNPAYDKLPNWVLRSMKKGEFTPDLISICKKPVYFLPQVVEVIREDAAWKASREIRQFLYGFLGISPAEKIVEIGRIDEHPMLSDDSVSPKNQNPPVSIQKIEGMEIGERYETVLAALECEQMPDIDMFFELDEKWKLPIAATFYWYRKIENVRDREDLVKGLLLCFLACCNEQWIQYVDSIPWSAHCLHMFAMWQCVYYDTMSLNHFARKPFEATSPAFLFSGKAVTYFVWIAQQDPSLDSILRHHPDGQKLFNTLLYLTTGWDLDGRRGDNAIPIFADH